MLILGETAHICCCDRDDDLWTVQSILIGVGGFWGGVFCMGLLYLLAVLTKRVFKPEEAEKIAEWRDAEIFYTLYMQEVAEPEKIKTEPVNNLLEIHRSKVCTALSTLVLLLFLASLHFASQTDFNCGQIPRLGPNHWEQPRQWTFRRAAFHFLAWLCCTLHQNYNLSR